MPLSKKMLCVLSMCIDSNYRFVWLEEICIVDFEWNVMTVLSRRYAFDSFVVVDTISLKPLNAYSLLFVCVSLNSNISLFV